ncbi:gamma-glutamylcyclotransferase family protein [Litchfieldella rifensis]|uniref:Gamma-glutamylcyclotransferase family protein n=1 Tax=Litchfieldella rifensis TaxID=762643 RepID=A0ABV7LS77_9GAMM
MAYLRYLLIGTASLTVALASYLWLILLSPYTYEAPEHLAPIESGEHQVFVYGTLRYAPVRWLVYGRAGNPMPATLEGYRRDALDLVKAPGESVRGLLLRVDAKELARLDRYERRGLRYKRVCMTLANGQRAWVYRRL